MNDENAAATRRDTGATLAGIATVLGCSVEAFRDTKHDPLNVKGASQLLTYWVEMDDGADRAKLLAFARRLAGEP